MSFGAIYSSSYWGLPVQNGWGGIYYDLSNPYNSITRSYETRALADGFTVESLDCVNSVTSTYSFEYLLKSDSGFLLQENGFKIII